MPLKPKLRYTPTKGTLGNRLRSTIERMPGDRTSRSLRREASDALRPQTGQDGFGETATPGLGFVA
jgi:hypothetical protein